MEARSLEKESAPEEKGGEAEFLERALAPRATGRAGRADDIKTGVAVGPPTLPSGGDNY